ncbi:ubiquinol-cytochrome c reductase iron-sulfur subunit [Chamaesiphon polymorphus]|uniref:Rieske Fe-S protein n=1 Tax=Chamaesiphon polymorphus CCALA 037 TaxID=2107692 RepID=A0A2T1GDB1_9CYAN|nr:Rieske 2Fe-2S domain-containing protein [Chamaesiphon polymorphus]PSB55418.1 Rieske Fe-S protein [Chamaesiphon polymorphus CCALA 037]
MIKRRSFLGYFSIGWLSACFPVVLAACAPKQSTTEATDSNSTSAPASDDKQAAKPAAKKTADGFTVVGSVAQLEQAGYLQTKQLAVVKDPANPKKLLAVNPKCTHQGCDVKWMAGEKKYECPCHNAEYAADGKVLKGPATKSLAKYPTKIVGTQVLVKV